MTIWDYVHLNDHASLTYELTTGFKPFTLVFSYRYAFFTNAMNYFLRELGEGVYCSRFTIPRSLFMIKKLCDTVCSKTAFLNCDWSKLLP